MKSPVWVSVVGLLLTLLSQAQDPDADLVARFFPQEVSDDTTRFLADHDFELPESFRYVAVDLDGTGRDEYLAAVYHNTEKAAIRLLKKENGSAIVVDRGPQGLRIAGRGRIFADDLDGDGTPEIIVETVVGPGGGDVLPFRWTGSRLALMAPTADNAFGGMYSLLNDEGFIDIDGDGVREALGASLPDGGPIYRLVDGVYAETGEVFFYHELFARAPGTPVPEHGAFRITNEGLYNLRIVNGEGGGDRVSSGEIRINGLVVVAANQLSQQVAELVVPVSLMNMNTLEVTLSAEPSGHIDVLIEPFDR